MIFLKSVILVCIALVAVFVGVTCNSLEKETSISPKEQAALEQFKKRVLSKIPTTSLIHKYAEDDLYMIRWLRTKNLDVNAAEKMFLTHLKWREDEKVDTIDQEEFPGFQKDFPFFHDTFEKKGQPILEIWYAQWKTREYVLAGKSKLLSRWITRNFEMNSRRLYNARAEGKEVAKAYILMELEGFSIILQACPACLPIYVNLMQLFESHFPDMYERTYLLSMPASFDLVLRLLRPAMSRSTRKALKSYVDGQTNLDGRAG